MKFSIKPVISGSQRWILIERNQRRKLYRRWISEVGNLCMVYDRLLSCVEQSISLIYRATVVKKTLISVHRNFRYGVRWLRWLPKFLIRYAAARLVHRLSSLLREFYFSDSNMLEKLGFKLRNTWFWLKYKYWCIKQLLIVYNVI